MKKTVSLSGKKLLLLGGVKPACEIVNEAKAMGVTVYVTDYLPDSPAKKIADESFMVSATDVDGVVALCHEKKVDGIITGYTDSLLPYCQEICDKLEKPFWGSAENIRMCVNKCEFKIACEKSGVSVVPWQIVTKENYLEIIDTVNLPLVVKPVDNSGSRGVFKCYEREKLEGLIEKSLSFSKVGEVILERAMNPNNEFSVYYIMNHGQCFLSGMGDRIVQIIDPEIAPVGQGMIFPSRHLENWIHQMDKPIRRFFRENQMNDGFVFVQGFVENDQFFIHEIGYRLNGGFSYKLVEHFSKYNQVQQLVLFSLSGDMEMSEIEKSNPAFHGVGMIVTASLKQGKIGFVSGVDEIRKMRGVLQFYQLHTVGDELLSHGTTAQVFAYILCAVENRTQMGELLDAIRDKLVVRDVRWNQMLNVMADSKRIGMENA